MTTSQNPSPLAWLQPDDLLEIARAGVRWLVAGAVLGLVCGVALWQFLPPRYVATTSILVEPQGVPESFVRSTITLALEARIDTLRQRVTSHANLNTLIDTIGAERLDPSGELDREAMMTLLRKRLEVEVENRGRGSSVVVDIDFWAREPQLAADVVKEIADLYIEENRKDRAQQAGATATFLEEELERVREDVKRHEGKVRAFRTEHLGALPSQLEANLAELERLNMSLDANLQAQETLTHRMALLRDGAGQRVAESRLSVALDDARSKLIEASRLYTEEHPTLQSLRRQVEELERQVAEERELRTGPSGMGREYEELSVSQRARQREERDLRDRLAEVSQRVEQTPSNEQQLAELTRDYDNLVATYERLLANRYDATLASNLEASQMAERFKLLRPPRAPEEPSWPDPFMLLPGGLVAGLGLAVLGILLGEFRNPSFHSVSGLVARLGLPVFASIPELDKKRLYEKDAPIGDLDWRVVVQNAPHSAAAEQYRGFLPHFLEADARRIVLVTSAAPGDGKSVTCLNLACSLAQDLGKRVLVIDADLRRASLHRLARTSRAPGLSDVLEGEVELESCVVQRGPNLWLLPAGSAAGNVLGLLTGEAFTKLRERASQTYDVVLIDSPPILPVADARILRAVADLVIFVVRAGGTPPAGAMRCLKELRGVAGLVYNGVTASAFSRYYHYHAYSRYDYDVDGDPLGLAREEDAGSDRKPPGRGRSA